MKREKQHLLSIIKELEDIKKKKPRLKLDVEEKAEWLEKKELTETEQKKLKEICCMIQKDKSDTLDKCQAIGALVISVLAAFIAAVSLVMDAAGGSQMAVPVAIGSLIFIALATVMALYTLYKTNKIAKSADIYRNTCIALTMLSDEQLQDSEK